MVQPPVRTYLATCGDSPPIVLGRNVSSALLATTYLAACLLGTAGNDISNLKVIGLRKTLKVSLFFLERIAIVRGNGRIAQDSVHSHNYHQLIFVRHFGQQKEYFFKKSDSISTSYGWGYIVELLF